MKACAGVIMRRGLIGILQGSWAPVWHIIGILLSCIGVQISGPYYWPMVRIFRAEVSGMNRSLLGGPATAVPGCVAERAFQNDMCRLTAGRPTESFLDCSLEVQASKASAVKT